jgi:hypothetical protein
MKGQLQAFAICFIPTTPAPRSQLSNWIDAHGFEDGQS